MQVIDTGFEGLKVVKLPLYKDDRGFFVERFNEVALQKQGINMKCIQVNHSFSVANVIRGLHFQQNPAQVKLVGVISGVILDVAVDLRKSSKTFGKHFSIKIEGPDTLLYIPAGFAHGFSVLSKEGANMIYIVEGIYNKDGEGGIIYNDNTLNINWQVEEGIVSSKDLELKTFEEYDKNPIFSNKF